MKIEILLSTYNEGLEKVKINSAFNYLIIHQVSNTLEKKYGELFAFKYGINENIRYVQCVDEKGLAKSRNTAIKNSKGDFVWIMDDDVEIFEGTFSTLERLISSSDCKKIGVFLLNFTTNYKDSVFCASEFQFKNLTPFNSFNVSSVNMLINNKLLNGNVLFDERFGLGTSLPSGEEYIYLNDVLKRGFKIVQTNIVASFHPPLHSGIDFYSTKEKVLAKKYMFKRVFGKIGIFLFLMFFLKKTPTLYRQKSIKSFFKFWLLK